MITSPLVVGSAGVGVTPPGPSHCRSGVVAMTEQVRVTVSPAMIGEEVGEVREMVGDTAKTVYGTKLH